MAPPLNPAEARIIDPILTNHARGYIHPSRVAQLLFPIVTVGQRGGRRIEFNKDSFKRYNTKRAPGAKRQEVQFGFLGKKFALEQRDLVGKVPIEIAQEAERVPGINMGRGAVEGVQDIMTLERECEAADLARDANTYDANHKQTLSGSGQWSHADSDPHSDVKDAKESIRATIGMRPNTMILGPLVFNALDEHPKLVERFKYSSSESVTLQMLARYFDIQTVAVGESIYAEDDTENFVDVWGRDVVLAYVPPQGARRMDAPAYGYTYQLDGHPFVGKPWYDDDTKSWKYPTTDEDSPEVVGADAGFLIKDAVAAL